MRNSLQNNQSYNLPYPKDHESQGKTEELLQTEELKET